MKMVMCIYNLAIDEEVQQVIHSLGIQAYTRWPRVTGCGVQTGPRFDDHVWPGANCSILMILEDEKADEVMNKIQYLRDTIGLKEGIFAYQMAVEKVTT